MTKVLNLATSEYITYSIPPEEAVVAAYEQSRGNWNTWQYPTFAEHLEARRGEYSVSCGDFAAITRYPKRGEKIHEKIAARRIGRAKCKQ